MNHYFVPAYFQSGLAPYNYVGTSVQDAIETFDFCSDEMPCDLYRLNEDTKMLEVYNPIVSGNAILDWEWAPLYRAWVVVRHNPGFNYPETVISKDGIFDTVDEAQKFIEKNGGDWKIYGFAELQSKMIESAKLMEQLKKVKA